MRRVVLVGMTMVGATYFSLDIVHAQTGEPTLASDSFASGLATGATLAPSTIVARLSAQLWVKLSYGSDSGSKTLSGKRNGVSMGSFARLYPRFDAKAANGLEYGATSEIRMNSNGSGTSTANALFFARYNGYVGIPALGRFYFGPENMATARLSVGTTMEELDYNGGFNGDIPTSNTGGTEPNYFFLRQASTFSSNNLVYISPAFAGFTIGTSWEPSQSKGSAAIVAGAASPTIASLPDATTVAPQRRNTFDGALRYRGLIGPATVTAFGAYVGSGHVNDSSATAFTARLKDWAIFNTGARVSFGRFSFGGNFLAGAYNAEGAGTLLRQGQRDGQSLVAGVQYVISPVVIGVQYINENTAGVFNQNPFYRRSMLHETGIVVGGAWDYAPGASLYCDAQYSQRHQTGINLLAHTNISSNTGNAVQSRAIQIGNTFRW